MDADGVKYKQLTFISIEKISHQFEFSFEICWHH